MYFIDYSISSKSTVHQTERMMNKNRSQNHNQKRGNIYIRITT